MKYSGVGGQAVLEGVMMRNGSKYAVAVRKPDGGIAVKYEKQKERSEFGEKCRKIPFVRGVIAFVDSISLGLKTLEYSASFLEEEEAAEKARAASGRETAEKTAEKNDGKKDSMMMAVYSYETDNHYLDCPHDDGMGPPYHGTVRCIPESVPVP